MVRIIHKQSKIVKMFEMYDRRMEKIDAKIETHNRIIKRLESQENAINGEFDTLITHTVLETKCAVCGKTIRCDVGYLYREWKRGTFVYTHCCGECKASRNALIREATINAIKNYIAAEYKVNPADVNVIQGLKSVITKKDGITWCCSSSDEYDRICERALEYTHGDE